MARTLVALLAGLIFGIGLVVSQMVVPAKVLGFLDVFGNWDPSLAFVMGGAILVSLVGVASFGAATAASHVLSGLVDWTLAAFFGTGGLSRGERRSAVE